MERTGLLPFRIGTLNRINYPQIISSATNAKTVSVADVSLSYLTVTFGSNFEVLFCLKSFNEKCIGVVFVNKYLREALTFGCIFISVYLWHILYNYLYVIDFLLTGNEK